MAERWVVCTRNPLYEVSDLGRVRRKRDGRLLKASQNHSRGGKRPGYFKVHLSRAVRNVYVHHLVAEAFLPPKPPGHDLDHIDWDRSNNAASNLRWMLIRENRVRWSPEGFISSKHQDREDYEGHEPMTEEERDGIYRELEAAGW